MLGARSSFLATIMRRESSRRCGGAAVVSCVWAVVLGLLGTARAQADDEPVAVITPASLATNDSAFGADTLSRPFHMQEVYGAQDFPVGTLRITELRFRPDYLYGKAFTTTVAAVEIRLSTTLRGPDGLSATFSENPGDDETVVFSGALPLSSAFTGPANGPKDFDMIVPLSVPFFYTPDGGNLLVDLRNYYASGASRLSGTISAEDTASRLFGSVTATTGGRDSGADALEVVGTLSAQPPPPTIVITSPTNGAAFVAGADITVQQMVSGLRRPYVVALYTNDGGSGAWSVAGTDASSGALINLRLGTLPVGAYGLVSSLTDSSGNSTYSLTNTFRVVEPLTITLIAPCNCDGATFDYRQSLLAVCMITGGTEPYGSVQFYTNGVAAGVPTADAPFYYQELGAFFMGDYTIQAGVTDASGWTSNTVVHTLTITGPLFASLTPANAATYLYGQPVTWSAWAVGGTAPYTAAFYTNGQWAGAAGPGPSPLTLPLGLLPIGSYAAYAAVADAAGTLTNSSPSLLTVLPNPVLVALTSPTNGFYPANQTLAVTATASVGAPLSVARVEVFWDGVSLGVEGGAAYATNLTLRDASSHTAYAVATDSLGASRTSAVVSVAGTFNGVFDPRQIKTVFVIPLENHDWTQVCPTCNPQQLLGNPAAPYVNSLATPGHSNAAQASYATKYYSVTGWAHPSEPNYIWSEAGTEYGVHTDNDPSVAYGNLYDTPNHLCRQLSDAGIAWKDYQEDLEYCPAASVSAAGLRPSGTNLYNGSRLYDRAVKHDPMQFFTDTQNTNVYPLAQLWTDLTNHAVGRYNWITPDEYNEMHSALSSFTYHGVRYLGNQAAIAAGDNFLSMVIPQIMASAAYQDHGVIIIWTDETESTDDTATTLPFFVISPLAKGNGSASSVVLSHSSTLRMMDEIFGLAFQTNAIVSESLDAQASAYNYVDGRSAVVNDLSDLFQVAAQAPRVVGGQMLPEGGGYQLTFAGPAGQTYQVLATRNPARPRSEWTVVGSGTFGSANVLLTDPGAMNYAGRFYTIKSP